MGALSGALAKLQANRPLRELREIAKGITKQLPENVQEATAKIDECACRPLAEPCHFVSPGVVRCLQDATASLLPALPSGTTPVRGFGVKLIADDRRTNMMMTHACACRHNCASQAACMRARTGLSGKPLCRDFHSH